MNIDKKNFLSKQIDGLNVKIKKLESVVNKTVLENNNKNTEKKNKLTSACVQNQALHINNLNNLTNTTIESYKINHPKESGIKMSKKYIGLLFSNNSNVFESDDNTGSIGANPFIKLSGLNIIINYSIQLDLDCTPLESTVCSLALGIRTKTDSKVKIIKGTKHLFDIAGSDVINSKLIISNTVLYSSEPNEDLCMIVDLGSNCVVNNKKSIIKIMSFN